jgi:hypothetical protein
VADDELSELLARALDDDAPAAPPADRIAALRERAAAQHAPDARPVTPAAPGGRGRSPWLAVAAVVVALLAGFGVARSFERDEDSGVAGDTEYDGPMTGSDGQTAAADLTVVGTGIGRVVDLRTGILPILPTGEYYQVWFVATDDAPDALDRISAGTFHPDPQGRSDVRFAAAVNPALYPIVEITAEPGDGNPLPTGPVVLRATIGE